MYTTPQGNRKTVSIFGMTNSGKSSLFNAITDTDNAIVSPVAGTTTDPVSKAMELLGHGPITLVDTAGLQDPGALGEERIRKTRQVLEQTDFAIYAIDSEDPGLDAFKEFIAEFEKRKIPYAAVITKKDMADQEKVLWLKSQLLKYRCSETIILSVKSTEDLEALKATLVKRLNESEPDLPLIGGLLPVGSVVLLVVPVDSEAPKGRLILPQVQLIRDCLDHGIRCHVTTEKQLEKALADLAKVDLVITDSQAFAVVSAIVPEHIPLTSFSILLARQKGDLNVLSEGIRAAENLQDGDTVLIAETCTHSRSHEDIGRVKIPALLKKKTGKDLRFQFAAGRDYPENLEQYSLVIHCGGCMITRKEMGNRMRIAREKAVPITNYGLVLAHCTGVLERSMESIQRLEHGH